MPQHWQLLYCAVTGTQGDTTPSTSAEGHTLQGDFPEITQFQVQKLT